MGDWDDDKRLAELLSQDLSAGTDEFREALLARCLDVLCLDGNAVRIEDEALESLAAAGDVMARGGASFDATQMLRTGLEFGE